MKIILLMIIFSVIIITPTFVEGYTFDESDPFEHGGHFTLENIRGEIVIVHGDSMDKLFDRGYLKDWECRDQCGPCPMGASCEPCTCLEKKKQMTPIEIEEVKTQCIQQRGWWIDGNSGYPSCAEEPRYALDALLCVNEEDLPFCFYPM